MSLAARLPRRLSCLDFTASFPPELRIRYSLELANNRVRVYPSKRDNARARRNYILRTTIGNQASHCFVTLADLLQRDIPCDEGDLVESYTVGDDLSSRCSKFSGDVQAGS
ncbi:hypothetical protein EVAR_49943_1 [Eumeta japonica]|uniref:Uncharacterized protein n=1 Tax=Eumeta variegata TaxID=151549 RepID=A0A4C1XTW4_EUMVA|nr:hypothetical protein EVAR_49943_1 [Eumeta japonica]